VFTHEKTWTSHVGFEVLTAVVMKSSVFWDITPCSPLKVSRRFGWTCRLHLQGRRISEARNKHVAGGKQRNPVAETSGLCKGTARTAPPFHELHMVAFIRLTEQDSAVTKNEMIIRMRWGDSVHVLYVIFICPFPFCLYFSPILSIIFLPFSFRGLCSFYLYRALIIQHIFHFHWHSDTFLSRFCRLFLFDKYHIGTE
jgi:hypothetical protein